MFLKKALLHHRGPRLPQPKKNKTGKVFSYYLGEVLTNEKTGSMFCPKGHYILLNICIHFFDLTFINKDIKCYLWKLLLLDFKGNIPVCAHDLNFKIHFNSL